jgi:DASS family divalent anion:Na+ symporter
VVKDRKIIEEDFYLTNTTKIGTASILTNKRVIGGVLGIAIAMVIAIQSPPAGLSAEGLRALAILCWAVTYWMFDVFPDYAVALMMTVLFVICNVVPEKIAFATFGSSSYWLLVAAIGLGVAATKSGLLSRTSLLVLTMFPATYRGQVIALIGCGTLIGPLIPSVTAKMAVMAPLGLAISDALGFKHKSPGSTGLFAALGTGFNLSCPIFLSSSFIGYIVVALLPAEYRPQFSWINWFLCAAVWGVVMLVGCTLAIFLLYRPDQKVSIPPEFIAGELVKMGPMKKDEKITLIVLLVTLAFWITEPWHKIPASIVALTGLSILLCLDIYDRSDFRKLIMWDALLFLGAVVNLGTVFSYLKVDTWVGTVLSPLLAPYTTNIILYIIALSILVYLARFIIASLTAGVSVLALVFIPVAAAQGIHPWVAGFTVYCAANIWNVFYQSTVWLAGYYATDGKMAEFGQMRKFSIAYMIISILGLIASIPLWHFMGFLK